MTTSGAGEAGADVRVRKVRELAARHQGRRVATVAPALKASNTTQSQD